VLSNGTYNFAYDAANQPVSGDNGQPSGSAVFIQDKIATGSSEYTTAHGGAPTNGSAPNYDFNVSGQGIASVETLNISRQDRLVPRERPVRQQGVTYTLKLKMRLQGQVSTPGIYADIRFRTLNSSYSGGQNHNKVYIRPSDMQSPDPDGWVEFTTTYTETADPNGGHLVAVFQRSSAASGSGTIEVKDFEVTTDQAVGPTTMAYTYDGNFKRVKQVEGGETIYSVYTLDGMLVHRESKVGSDPAEVTDYISVAGMSIARITDGVPTYLYTNHLGTPIVGASTAGAVEWMETLTPYGEAWSLSAANDNDTAFTGHIRDKSTGLTYMQARMYDPNVGRFLSVDPIGYAVGNTNQFNRYAYGNNNPIQFTDPLGLDAVDCVEDRDAETLTCEVTEDDEDEIVVTYTVTWWDDWNGVEQSYTNERTIDWGDLRDRTASRDAARQLNIWCSNNQVGASCNFKFGRISKRAAASIPARPVPFAGQMPEGRKDPRFVPLGRGAYRSREDGSIWEKDRDGHGGSTWKRWENEKDWERGRKSDQSIRDDGSVR